MESWIPRRPSSELRRRIFEVQGPEVAGFGVLSAPLERAGLERFAGWLVPAMAGVFALFVSLNPTTDPLTSRFIGPQEISAFARTPMYATLQSAALHSAANSLPAASFTWTNLPNAHSTNASFSGDNPPF